MYARDVAAAISPLPCRHSTPWPPHTSVSLQRTSPLLTSLTACTRPFAPSISKSSSLRYTYLNPLVGFASSIQATLKAALTASSSPIRAPELALMYTQGKPSFTAKSKPARYTASSFGENEPDMCVMSLATRIISRPSTGYSSVTSVTLQHTIPTSFKPGGRLVGTK